MRQRVFSTCAATIAMLFVPSLHAATSSFAAGSEGWTALGDVAGSITWTAAGGNPGGHVLINDAVTGGVTYFVAPTAFLGNVAMAIGTSLTFDLQQVYPGLANQFDDSDVILVGSGLTIAYDTPSNPANGSWTSYIVPLTAAGWHVGNPSGASVTDAQFLNVMSNLSALRIRAEFQTGADTDKLDNVTLADLQPSAVPEPSTCALLVLGIGILVPFVRLRKRQVNSDEAVQPCIATNCLWQPLNSKIGRA